VINLQVLGRLELYGEDGRVLHSVLAQPKRQGLLVYLAVAVPRGYHRRDTLVGLFWPESDDERARASLSKAVSHLRQAIGADTLLSRGHGELGIDWHRLWCDAVGFEEALDRGALAEAMALYVGDLLPGFHVDEAPEFDQWLERERARLRGRAVQATRILSEREEASGDLATSIEWARRAALLEPFDESIVRRLMTILEKSADRAGALRTYEEFAAHLRSELETEPSAETTTVMESIRDRATPATSIHAMQALTPAVATIVAPELASAPMPVLAPVRTRMRSRLAAVALAAGAVATLAAWGIVERSRPAAGVDAPTAVVAVLPFVVEGDKTAANLGDGMVTLLAERFNHDGPLRAVDAKSVRKLARPLRPDATGADSARLAVERFHPRFVLLGRVTVKGDSLRISAELFDSMPGRNPMARAEIAGASDDVARLAGDIAWQILATQPTGAAPRDRPPLAAMTTSLVALRAFLAG
jgi:DNA-binding SARP family transcriptional activator/TolB-like protein